MSMTGNQNHDDGGVAPWSDLNHDVLFLVMMKLGIIDFVSFSGVCKSWRSLALCNTKRFMTSRPPMSMYISNDDNENECYCYFEDFEGRKFKTLVPHSAGRICVGLTCGYLILFGRETKDFWLVNPITRHQLHFPNFPCFAKDSEIKAILVSSPSILGWVLVVINTFTFKIWFSIASKGEWNHVPCIDYFRDIHAFKGKIYTLNVLGRLYEMSLNPNPKLTILEIENCEERHVYHQRFVSSGENLYVSGTYHRPHILYEIDFGEMKLVPPKEEKFGEYAFFLTWKNGVAVKPESWAVDPRSGYKGYDCFRDTSDETRKGKFFDAERWYFPHLCLDVDLINE